MKTILTLTSLFIGLVLFSQPVTETFSGNNFNWIQTVDGPLFLDADNGLAGLEAPAGSGLSPLFSSSLWISGINANGEILSSAQPFSCNTQWDNEYCEFGPGPLRLDGTAYSPGEEAGYNRFWFVSSDEVDTHNSYYDCLSDPGCDVANQFPNGYEIPEDILNWPAEGDTSDGFSPTLAPFFDRNADGSYNANEGDHPSFCGAFTSYAIANDVVGTNLVEGSQSLGIEVHTMVYGYLSAMPSLFNTLFFSLKIINRSSNIYSDFYIGRFSDYDVGNPHDDYVGTDVERAMVFGYNGDLNDEPSIAGSGYGTDVAAIGLKVLKGPLSDPDGMDNIALSDYGEYSSGWDDGIVDNERIGLSSSMSNTNVGAGISVYPFLPFEFHNYLNGTWPDGTGQIFGGSGYNAAGLGIPARYVFPGLSDPYHYGTDGVDPNYPDPAGWTEESEGHAPSDRRIVASSGRFHLCSGRCTNHRLRIHICAGVA